MGQKESFIYFETGNEAEILVYLMLRWFSVAWFCTDECWHLFWSFWGQKFPILLRVLDDRITWTSGYYPKILDAFLFAMKTEMAKKFLGISYTYLLTF